MSIRLQKHSNTFAYFDHIRYGIHTTYTKLCQTFFGHCIKCHCT